MKVLCVHRSGLMCNDLFLRLEPLGVELWTAAVRKAGHDTRLLDLQTASHRDLLRTFWDGHVRVPALSSAARDLHNMPLAKTVPSKHETQADGRCHN
jgi:hypothetical protein